MKIKANKILSILLAVVTVISIISMSAVTTHAETITGTNGGNWSFNDETGVLTISGTGSMNNYQTEYDGNHSPWYSFKDDITSVIIESGVLSIGDAAFHKCSNLKTVSIPDSVKSIGSSSFKGCSSLTSITIPYGVKEIENYTFAGCSNLTSVIMPNSVTMIDHQAFSGCTSLTDIKIPNSVTAIATAAFWHCSGLISVTFPDSVTYIGAMSFMECTSLKNITIPDSVTEICARAFNLCDAITDVYYLGTPEQWYSIKIGNDNIPLYTATIHYNYISTDKFTGIKNDYFYKNDVRVRAYNLVEFEGNFYYTSDGHKLAKDKRIYLTAEQVSGFTYADGTQLVAGYYNFDSDGKMIMHNGVVGDYFYKNNVRVKAYNLIEFEGNFYYTSDGHKLAKDKRVYLIEKQVEGFTYEDGAPLVAGYYTFDADGKMIMLNGVVGDYFYENNVRVRAYNLVEFEGNFYYTSDGHKLAKDKRIYLNAEQVAGFTYADGTPLKVGYYNFDADGKMIVK